MWQWSVPSVNIPAKNWHKDKNKKNHHHVILCVFFLLGRFRGSKQPKKKKTRWVSTDGMFISSCRNSWQKMLWFFISSIHPHFYEGQSYIRRSNWDWSVWYCSAVESQHIPSHSQFIKVHCSSNIRELLCPLVPLQSNPAFSTKRSGKKPRTCPGQHSRLKPTASLISTCDCPAIVGAKWSSLHQINSENKKKKF